MAIQVPVNQKWLSSTCTTALSFTAQVLLCSFTAQIWHLEIPCPAQLSLHPVDPGVPSGLTQNLMFMCKLFTSVLSLCWAQGMSSRGGRADRRMFAALSSCSASEIEVRTLLSPWHLPALLFPGLGRSSSQDLRLVCLCVLCRDVQCETGRRPGQGRFWQMPHGFKWGVNGLCTFTSQVAELFFGQIPLWLLQQQLIHNTAFLGQEGEQLMPCRPPAIENYPS